MRAAVFLGRTFFIRFGQLTSLIQKFLVRDSDKKYLKKLGANIKRLREAKGLSLRQLSYACNVDNSKIAKIEKGQINITFTTILQLANALELRPSDLLDIDFE